jgi:hypothetical protein
LLLGETLDIGDQSSEHLTLLGLGDRILREPGQMLDRVGTRQKRPPQLVDAAVVGYAIQPRPQRELALATAQARVGSHEDLLHRVLGILWRASEHLTRIDEQALAIAIMDHPEGILAAGSEQRYELLVAA